MEYGDSGSWDSLVGVYGDFVGGAATSAIHKAVPALEKLPDMLSQMGQLIDRLAKGESTLKDVQGGASGAVLRNAKALDLGVGLGKMLFSKWVCRNHSFKGRSCNALF